MTEDELERASAQLSKVILRSLKNTSVPADMYAMIINECCKHQLKNAHARGVKEGMEKAAKICDVISDDGLDTHAYEYVARLIRFEAEEGGKQG